MCLIIDFIYAIWRFLYIVKNVFLTKRYLVYHIFLIKTIFYLSHYFDKNDVLFIICNDYYFNNFINNETNKKNVIFANLKYYYLINYLIKNDELRISNYDK